MGSQDNCVEGEFGQLGRAGGGGKASQDNHTWPMSKLRTFGSRCKADAVSHDMQKSQTALKMYTPQ